MYTMDEAPLGAFLDFEDGLVDDMSGDSDAASQQPSPAAGASTSVKIATTVLYDGKDAKKGVLVRRAFAASTLNKSRELRCRGYMIGPKRNDSDASGSSTADADAETTSEPRLHKNDPAILLVHVPGQIAITLARVVSISPRLEPNKSTDAIAWSALSNDFIVALHVHATSPTASGSGDGCVVTIPGKMVGAMVTAPGDLIGRVDPDQVTSQGKLAWSISVPALRTMGDLVWDEFKLRSADFPKISLTGALPYCDVNDKPISCEIAEADGGVSSIGDPNKRKCPKCQKLINSNEFRVHIASHILRRDIDPRVCGYCGHFGKACTVGLRHSSGFGASKVYSACGECSMDRSAYKRFNIKNCSAGATAVCSQMPMKCPECPGEVFVWKFAMHAHVYTHHGRDRLVRLVEDPLFCIFDHEWTQSAAMTRRRRFLLPSTGFPMDGNDDDSDVTATSTVTGTTTVQKQKWRWGGLVLFNIYIPAGPGVCFLKCGLGKRLSGAE